MKNRTILILVTVFVMVDITPAAARSFLFHATRRAVAQKIAKKGFLTTRMKASARMGKGAYLTDSKRTALKEVPSAGSVVRFEPTNRFKGKVVDLWRPTAERIHALTPRSDLRGAVKKQVIGPKLGRRLGHKAAQDGEILRYRSARDPQGSNYFVPKKLVDLQRPSLFKKGKVLPAKK